MNKSDLNKQIVLCRPAVKRAKVCTIRRLIRKIKLLKSCKREDEKEKKLKKADRLVQQLFLIKKVRVDDVTKFALVQKDPNDILRKTNTDDHEHVYALLAKQEDVQKRINSIKEKIPDYDNAISDLLKTLGERTKLKQWRRINKGLDPKSTKKEPKNDEKKGETTEKVSQKGKSRKKDKTKKEVSESSGDSDIDIPPVKEEKKVVDSFFIDKKVIQPKLLVSNEDKFDSKLDIPEDGIFRPTRERSFTKIERRRVEIKTKTSGPKEKSYKTTTVEVPSQSEEQLHPSWAAKKVKLIQPFQGKKTKFNDD